MKINRQTIVKEEEKISGTVLPFITSDITEKQLINGCVRICRIQEECIQRSRQLYVHKVILSSVSHNPVPRVRHILISGASVCIQSNSASLSASLPSLHWYSCKSWSVILILHEVSNIKLVKTNCKVMKEAKLSLEICVK